MSFYNTNELDKENNTNFTSEYFDSIQFQTNSRQDQSKMIDNQQSVIKKLLYSDCPFNMQMSDYQKKLLLHENSRLTMKTAQKILTNEQQPPAEQYQSSTKKSVQKSNYKSHSTQFSQQQIQSILQQKQQQNEEQSELNKNIWDELYEKVLNQGLKKKLMIELQMKQGEQDKFDSEVQELTFQPKLVADSSLFNINQPFQERNSNWQDAKCKRLAEIKKYYNESEDYKQIKECTFQPQILNKSRQLTYEKTKKFNENQNYDSQQKEILNSQQQKNASSTYKQIALSKQQFNKQKNLLHKQLQELEINL